MSYFVDFISLRYAGGSVVMGSEHCRTSKMSTTLWLETSRFDYPLTQLYIPEEKITRPRILVNLELASCILVYLNSKMSFC